MRDGWEYRVVRRHGVLGIYEVFYHAGCEEPVTCTKDPIPVTTSVPGTLRERLDLMAKALEKPTLEYDEIGG